MVNFSVKISLKRNKNGELLVCKWRCIISKLKSSSWNPPPNGMAHEKVFYGIRNGMIKTFFLIRHTRGAFVLEVFKVQVKTTENFNKLKLLRTVSSRWNSSQQFHLISLILAKISSAEQSKKHQNLLVFILSVVFLFWTSKFRTQNPLAVKIDCVLLLK